MPAISGLPVEGDDQLRRLREKLVLRDLARDAFTGTSREHRSLVWLHDALGKPGSELDDLGSDGFLAELYVRLWYRGVPDGTARLMVAYAALRTQGPRRGRRPSDVGQRATHQETFHALAVHLGLWDQRQSPGDLARQVRRTRLRLREFGIEP